MNARSFHVNDSERRTDVRKGRPIERNARGTSGLPCRRVSDESLTRHEDLRDAVEGSRSPPWLQRGEASDKLCPNTVPCTLSSYDTGSLLSLFEHMLNFHPGRTDVRRSAFITANPVTGDGFSQRIVV